jgi:hypothetical protein
MKRLRAHLICGGLEIHHKEKGMRMQSVLRAMAVMSAIGILLLAQACRQDYGATEQMTANRNAAGNNPAQANENHNRATEGAAVNDNVNRSSETSDASSEDFEGTIGIVEKKKTTITPILLRDVRTASHEKFDRVVFEFDGDVLPGYHVEYVDRPVRRCGSGKVVPLTGDGWLVVEFTPANAHTDEGEASIKDRERKLNLEALKELKIICDFEAEVSWVMSLSRPNRYRVLELSNPARIVVDVKY